MAAPLDVSRHAAWEAAEVEPEELDASDMYDDAAAKTALYARLSRDAAAAGDVVIAVAAAWAADVHAVQALWWERARDAGGGPFEPFLTAGAAIAGGQEGVVPSAGVAGRDDARTARGVVESARRGLLAVFDPPAALLVAARLAGVDHLAALPAPGSLTARPVGAALTPFLDRVAGTEPAAVLDGLWTVALDARAVARGLETAGFAREAVEQLVQAETAHFEAYLLRSAVAVGDTDLLGADLRRALLADLLPAPLLLPQDVGGAQGVVREVMRAVLGAGEVGRYARLLAAYDAADIPVELPEHVRRPLAPPVPAPPVPAQCAPARFAPVPFLPTQVVKPVPEQRPAPPPIPAWNGRGAPGAAGACPERQGSVWDRREDASGPLALRPEERACRVDQTDAEPVGPAGYRVTESGKPLLTSADRVVDCLPAAPEPPAPAVAAEAVRHRDIYAQDIGGQGPRAGTLRQRPAARS